MTGTGGGGTGGTYVSENGYGIITTTEFIHDFSWDDIASIFNGGRLIRTEAWDFGASSNPVCGWMANIIDLSMTRQRAFINTLGTAGDCFIPRNTPVSIDLVSVLRRVEGPQILTQVSEGVAYMQSPVGGLVNNPTSKFTPSLAGVYLSGYGVLTGTEVQFTGLVIGGNTLTPYFPDCPGIGSYSAVGALKELKFLLIENSPNPGQMTLQITVSTVRTGFLTYYKKSTGSWEIPPLHPSYPAPPVPTYGWTLPYGTNPPYGATYIGDVDCDRKDYIRMTRSGIPAVVDPLGYYPSTIELIGS